MAHEMVLDKDVGIAMRDGAMLARQCVPPQGERERSRHHDFRPLGKDVHISQFQPPAWAVLTKRYPQILEQSSCKHLVFETPDPELWVPHGYVVLKVDSRGAGKSPGKLDVNAPGRVPRFLRRHRWAGGQPWAAARSGSSASPITPPASGDRGAAAAASRGAAAVAGTYDFFRDRTRADGIYSRGFRRPLVGAQPVAQPARQSVHRLSIDIVTGERTPARRASRPRTRRATARIIRHVLAHPTSTPGTRRASPTSRRSTLPTSSVANWGGLALHLRGTIAGCSAYRSREKWLKVQSGPYFITFLHARDDRRCSGASSTAI